MEPRLSFPEAPIDETPDGAVPAGEPRRLVYEV